MIFKFSDHFIRFNYFWADFGRYLFIYSFFFWGFRQIEKSKMADQDGRHSEMVTQLLCHLTSSTHDADIKKDSFRHTIYPPSLVVIAFIFSKLQREAEYPPPPHTPTFD